MSDAGAEHPMPTRVDWPAPTPARGSAAARMREQTTRVTAEAAERRAAFLAEATMLLNVSLDPETVLERSAQLAVPMLGEWCRIQLMREDGAAPPRPAWPVGAGQWRARVVPFDVDGEHVGSLILGVAGGGRALPPEDEELAEAFAMRVGLALGNARRLARAEAIGAERERERIAARLHDALSDVLFAIGLKLDWCRRKLPADRPPDVDAGLDEIRRDIGGAMAQIREFIGELSPPGLGAFCPEGLGAVVDRFRTLTGIRLEQVARGDFGRLDAARAELLRCVVQEALTNVAKHSRAGWACVSLTIGPTEAVFEVLDDGVGPSPDGSDDGVGHFGLRQMRERLEAMGGRLAHGRREPAGFRLAGALPLRG